MEKATTRLEYHNRFEIITHRIQYLEELIAESHEEKSALETEQKLIKELNDLYANTKDTIDAERAKRYSTTKVRKKRSNSTREELRNNILDLLKQKSCTVQMLANEFDISSATVNRRLNDLIQIGLVEKDGKVDRQNLYKSLNLSMEVADEN